MRNPTGPQLNGCLVAAVVLLLCFCIIVQMLGAPVTLLSAVVASDTLSMSVSEGFSVPPCPPQLTPVLEGQRLCDVLLTPQSPLLPSSVFHPPVS